MERRLILAIALSMLVVVGFQYLFVKPVPPHEMASRDEIARGPQKVSVKPSQEKIVSPLPSIPNQISEERELELETEKYILTFSNIGGAIKKIRLKDYNNGRSKEPLEIVNITDPERYLFQLSDPTNSLSLDRAAYEFKKDKGMIAYSLKSKDLEIEKRFILRNTKYIIELQLFIKNISGIPKELTYRIIGGSGLTEESPADMRFVEILSKVDGKLMNFKRPKNGRIINPGIVSWTALKNKYFSIILKPFIQTKNQFYEEIKTGHLVTGVEATEFVVPPASLVDYKFALYAGPAQPSAMKEFKLEFEESVTYGFFGWISKALMYVMRLCYLLVRNRGLSIILLSIFLNLILSPLTFKSFKSMQKMQALHPQMEKLKSQHKDNPQKLNKEMLELYKKNKINPFSGCLPMVLQMPIFIALYNALMRSIELKGTSFLWAKDLSMPDAIKIPITLPLVGNSLNILPLIMVLLMVIQQNISSRSMGGAVTDEQKQQQKIMLIMMPVMFGFIFYNMPSGLVLYWITSTILTTAEQYMMLKNA